MNAITDKRYKFLLFRSGGDPDGPADLGNGALSDGKMIVEDLETRYGDWEGRGFPEDEKGPHTILEGCDIMAYPEDGKGQTFMFGDCDWEDFGEAQ